MTSSWPTMALRSSAMICVAAALHAVGERDVVGRIEVDGVGHESHVSPLSVSHPVDDVVDAVFVGFVVEVTGAKPVSENSQYSLMSPLKLAIAIRRFVGSLSSKMPGSSVERLRPA